ncbi:MAG: porin family protein [Methylobacter sp.]|nr:porin family protein [Methylobacter sp.]
MINKTKLALGIAATLTMTGALVSPQAMAHSKADRVAEATSNKVDALQAQLQAMQAELSGLKADRSRTHAEAGKVQELDQWMASVKSAPKDKRSKDNMVFFRGGFAQNFSNRDDILTMNQTILGNAGGGRDMSASKNAYDIGAGFDFSLNDNLFGLMDNTEVLAELMFEYKKFGTQHSQLNGVPSNTLCAVGGATGALTGTAALGTAASGATGRNCQDVTVSQFTLAAAPKVKFMKGSALRPWVIPVGLAVHVISPPSNGVTVFNPGAMFALGADYKIWKEVYVGADARYHWTASDADGVKTDGYTAGGYLGIGF